MGYLPNICQKSAQLFLEISTPNRRPGGSKNAVPVEPDKHTAYNIVPLSIRYPPRSELNLLVNIDRPLSLVIYVFSIYVYLVIRYRNFILYTSHRIYARLDILARL